ncbi:C-GCAxxG-C-C family protein [Clostridiaceae bacterium OttesenSCG-928-D20]|nr:C-GCAxxG-C-C family protein [Clostridiaceae bacterium OttesenSCG-928-D20]
MNKSEIGLKTFDGGFNCAQAVLTAYCEDFGLDRETALKLSCGFGGGISRLGQICGAASAAIMLLGLKHGQSQPEDKAAKEKTYAEAQEFARRFKEKNGSLLCNELLGVDLITGDRTHAAERVKTVCPKAVKDAIEIVGEMLAQD